MRLLLASAAFVSGVVLSTAALAATVTPTSGEVSINRGTGFQRIGGTVETNVGDSIMAGLNGTARIVYPDGCLIPVIPGKVITITGESPCMARAQASQEENEWTAAFFALGVVGVGVGFYFMLKDNADLPASP